MSEILPIVCKPCLGDDKMMKMSRMEDGEACVICEEAFTSYWWKIGELGRRKKTHLCRRCAKLKNVCQSCLKDLDFGLTIETRDLALGKEDYDLAAAADSAYTDRTRRYQLIQAEQKLNSEQSANRMTHSSRQLKAARVGKLLRKVLGSQSADRDDGGDDDRGDSNATVCSLWLGGDVDALNEKMIRDAFDEHAPLPPERVNVLSQSRCAFVEFDTHEHAKQTLGSIGSSIRIGPAQLIVRWARAKKQFGQRRQPTTRKREPLVGESKNRASNKRQRTEKQPEQQDQQQCYRVRQDSKRYPYPSMDPSQFGSPPDAQVLSTPQSVPASLDTLTASQYI
jgi:STL11, N-terminal